MMNMKKTLALISAALIGWVSLWCQPVPGKINPGSSTTASSLTYSPAGTGAVPTTQAEINARTVSVLDYMTAAHRAALAAGTLTADATYAFNAAMTYLGTKGGTIRVPRGVIPCNVVVNQDNVTLWGPGGGSSRTLTNTGYLVPYTIANPVIQIGNDSRAVYGTQLVNLTLYGPGPNGTGQTGLFLAGGAQYTNVYNLTAYQFLGHELKIGPGSSYPIQYNNFYSPDFQAHTASASTAVVGVYYGTGGSWTTATYVYSGNIHGNTLSGYAVILDSAEISVLGGWIQAVTAHGLKVMKSQASSPKFRGDCDFEITGGGEGVKTFDTTPYQAYVSGNVRWSGGPTLVDSGSTSHPMNAGAKFGAAELWAPHALDFLYMGNSTLTDPTATTIGLYCSGSGLFRIFNNYGTSNKIELETNGNVSHYGNGTRTVNLYSNSASAVNYLELGNAITGANPYVLATGTDTDVSLTLAGKGLGLTRSKNSVSVYTVGQGLQVKEGTNAKQGVATLVSGTVTVNNTSVTANSSIFVVRQGLNSSTACGCLSVNARTAGTSFTITSYNAGAVTTCTGDLSTVAWEIFEPAN
jgi:hypothetical protein